MDSLPQPPLFSNAMAMQMDRPAENLHASRDKWIYEQPRPDSLYEINSSAFGAAMRMDKPQAESNSKALTKYLAVAATVSATMLVCQPEVTVAPTLDILGRHMPM